MHLTGTGDPVLAYTVCLGLAFVCCISPRKLVLLESSRNEQRRKGSMAALDSHVLWLSGPPRGLCKGARRHISERPVTMLLACSGCELGTPVCVRTRVRGFCGRWFLMHLVGEPPSSAWLRSSAPSLQPHLCGLWDGPSLWW